MLGRLLGTGEELPVGRLALATFVFAAFVTLVLTLERRRWLWSAAAAVGVGALLALIGWTTAQYNGSSWSFGWPFASALVASLLLLPLFQTVRDLGEVRLPPERVHAHVWADFVIGAVGVAFVGVVLLLGVLIDQLLRLVGIDWIERLWATEWFGWAVAGAAFGAVAARLRDRAGLLGTLLIVKFTVFAVLAPVLAVGIVVFLGALPFGGLATFWAATGSSTVILLACAGLAVWLVNAVLGNHSGSARGEGVGGRVLRGSALVLALTVLPLALIGAAGLWIRVDALGWTPTRLWGVAAIGVAVVWGGVYLWTAVRARRLDDGAIFAGNVRMAVGVAVVALLLALPVVDFGAVSTRSQLARLESGRIAPGDFDWRALANEFGPTGRRVLERIARTGPPDRRQAAAKALDPERFAKVQRQSLPARLDARPQGTVIPKDLVTAIASQSNCGEGRCVVWLPAPDVAVLLYREGTPRVRYRTIFRGAGGKWPTLTSDSQFLSMVDEQLKPGGRADDDVEVRSVTRRQVFIGGKPAGDTFE